MATSHQYTPGDPAAAAGFPQQRSAGPSANSSRGWENATSAYQTQGGEYVRSWNNPDLECYLSDHISCRDGEHLTEEQMVMEKIMLALRTSEGIPEDYLRQHCNPEAYARALAECGLVRLPDGRVRIPEDRFFISDAIISDLI